MSFLLHFVAHKKLLLVLRYMLALGMEICPVHFEKIPFKDCHYSACYLYYKEIW